jgi:hypothetical protein
MKPPTVTALRKLVGHVVIVTLHDHADGDEIDVATRAVGWLDAVSKDAITLQTWRATDGAEVAGVDHHAIIRTAIQNVRDLEGGS